MAMFNSYFDITRGYFRVPPFSGFPWPGPVKFRSCDENVENRNSGRDGVLNRHDASFLKELIWVVVDQLSVDEDLGVTDRAPRSPLGEGKVKL